MFRVSSVRLLLNIKATIICTRRVVLNVGLIVNNVIPIVVWTAKRELF